MTSPIETMTHEHAVKTMAPERYLLEEMSELERHAFEEHFFSCPDCAEDVRMFEMMRAGARDMPAAQAIPFKPRESPRWSVAAPWAAAASLALVVGYQALSQPVEQPYAVEPVTLRASSRGADVVIEVGPGKSAVALAIDASAPAGVSEWVYAIAAADGSQVAAGRAPVPAPGVPLLLVVPAATISTPNVYVLSLREREGSPVSSEYRFSVISPRPQP